MSEPRDPHADLLDELRSVLDRVDPTPPEVTEFAKAALGWRRLDADLAELLADSALETESDCAHPLGRLRRPLAHLPRRRPLDRRRDPRRRRGAYTARPARHHRPWPRRSRCRRPTARSLRAAESDSLGRFRLTLEAGGRVRLRILRNDQPTRASRDELAFYLEHLEDTLPEVVRRVRRQGESHSRGCELVSANGHASGGTRSSSWRSPPAQSLLYQRSARQSTGALK